MISASVTNNVSYLSVYIRPAVARAMAETLNLAADIVEAQAGTEDENPKDKTVRDALAELAPGTHLAGTAITNAARATLAEQLANGPTTLTADLAEAVLAHTTTEMSV